MQAKGGKLAASSGSLLPVHFLKYALYVLHTETEGVADMTLQVIWLV